MPHSRDKALANRLKLLASELSALSKNIESSENKDNLIPLMFTNMGHETSGHRDTELAEYAEHLYRERQQRMRFFPSNIFSEPAWDILLDLFINAARNRPISITSACIAGGIPATTGLRWLGVLEQEGLLVRETSGDDARVTWVRLSPHGMNAMRAFIEDASGISGAKQADAASSS